MYSYRTKGLNGLVRFAESLNLVSARIPSHFNWPLHQIACTEHFGSCVMFRTILGDYWFWSWPGYPQSWTRGGGGLRVDCEHLQASRKTPSNVTSSPFSFFSLHRVSVRWSSHSIILAVWGRENVVKRPLSSSWTAVVPTRARRERTQHVRGWSSVAGDLAWEVLLSFSFFISYLSLLPSPFL